jgi:DNA (cytosine-5)-methyltransferase 1
MKPLALDTFCGAGGAGMGYYRAGFQVIGIDLECHADYPFPMIVGDAMDYLTDAEFLAQFDLIHASPPCPRYSVATPAAARDSHPDLVGPVRDALRAWGGTYVIENVPGAPLENPTMLCGSAFGLRVRRHRLFESNAFLMSPGCFHDGKPVVGVYGAHADRPGGWLRPDGSSRGVKATSVEDAQDALGIDWMSRWEDLADSIPPAFSEYLGAQILDQLTEAVA